MASEISSSQDQNSNDPYLRLGVKPGASFEEIKNARDLKLLEVGDDPRSRAMIESSYDSLLMVSLKERQLGKVSTEAINASEREEKVVESLKNKSFPNSFFNGFSNINNSREVERNLWPELYIPEGQGFSLRLVLGGLAIILLLVSPSESTDLILSLSLIGVLVSFIKKGRKILFSLGWGVVLMSVGLMFGRLLTAGISAQLPTLTTVSPDNLEALPALILLLLASLILG